MSSGSTSSAALDNKKLAKFVELLVHDYLKTKGFRETGAKFAEECSKEAGDAAGQAGSDGVDEAGSWYCLSDKLALPELLRHNAMAALGQRFASVIEVLIQEMVRERDGKTSAPSSVSIASVRDAKGRRRPMADQNATTQSTTTAFGTGGLGSTGSEVSTVTASKGSQESLLTGRGGGVSSTGVLPGGRGGCSTTNETVGEAKERCKTSPLQGKMGASRGNLGCRIEGRETTRKHHTVSAKRGHGLSSPPKGGRTSRDTAGMLNKFQFSKDALRRHQMSHESWIPEDLRMKMMRRSMAVIKENVYESVAQRSLVRKEKKRTNRSELEIVKTQEKFGTKQQRPCALCEQRFSEVNLVLAVPFKAIVDLRIAWQKTLPQATGSTTKTNRTMLMPPQCYNEVKVCAFCSQLFHDPLGYRPTWDMEVSRMRKKREQLALEKEREYWDPLRHSSLHMATQSKEQEQQVSPPDVVPSLPVETAA